MSWSTETTKQLGILSDGGWISENGRKLYFKCPDANFRLKLIFMSCEHYE